MDSVDYTFQFREKYLADQLAPDEKAAFEEELTKNPELLEALKEQIYLGNMLGEFLDESDSTALLDSEELSKVEKVGIFRQLFSEPQKIAAALVVLLLCGWALWWMTQPNEFQQIASQEFQHFSNKEVAGLDRVLGTPDPNDTSQQAQEDPLKYAAFEAYVKDDYVGAFDKLTTYIKTGKDATGGALFYRGIAAMETERYGQAVQDFENYLDNYIRGDYIEDALWYQSLAKLQVGRVSEAKMRLQELAKKGTKYKGRAGDLLRKLGE